MSAAASVVVVLVWLGLVGLTVDAWRALAKICEKYSSRG